MLAYPLALMLLLGFAASFAFADSLPDTDDDPPPEGEELIGGGGDDTLTGGAGADTFILDIGPGSLSGAGAPPILTDYTAGEDHIALTLFHPATDTSGDAFPPPAVIYETDTEANEIRILSNDEVLAVLTGTTDFDPGDLSVTLRASGA